MALPKETERPIPEPQSAVHAFDAVNARHSRAWTVETINAHTHAFQNVLAKDYVAAAIAYFANRTDNQYLKDVGTKSLDAIQEKLINPICMNPATTDETLITLPQQTSQEAAVEVDSPPLLGLVPEAKGVALITTAEFIMLARTNPVDALGEIAPALSITRDIVNGRGYLDSQTTVQTRAIATCAEFVLQAYAEDPQQVTGLGDFCLASFFKFPMGMLSLPSETLYPLKATSAGGSL